MMLVIMVVLLDASEVAKTGVMVVAKVRVPDHVTPVVRMVVTTLAKNRAKAIAEAIVLFLANL